MKTARLLWIALSIALASAGAHVLLDSIHHPDQYADEYVLLGGTLSALALFPIHLAFKQHWQKRALELHMRRGTHLSKGIETKS
jgi:hypothetical protein